MARQIKNCKVGHFVKYNDILCQVNCFAGDYATLVEVKEKYETKRIIRVRKTEKAEYLGEVAKTDGCTWIGTRINPLNYI